MAGRENRKDRLASKANRPRRGVGKKQDGRAKSLCRHEVEFDRARFHNGIQVDVDGVKESKEG